MASWKIVKEFYVDWEPYGFNQPDDVAFARGGFYEFDDAPLGAPTGGDDCLRDGSDATGLFFYRRGGQGIEYDNGPFATWRMRPTSPIPPEVFRPGARTTIRERWSTSRQQVIPLDYYPDGSPRIQVHATYIFERTYGPSWSGSVFTHTDWSLPAEAYLQPVTTHTGHFTRAGSSSWDMIDEGLLNGRGFAAFFGYNDITTGIDGHQLLYEISMRSRHEVRQLVPDEVPPLRQIQRDDGRGPGTAIRAHGGTSLQGSIRQRAYV